MPLRRSQVLGLRMSARSEKRGYVECDSLEFRVFESHPPSPHLSGELLLRDFCGCPDFPLGMRFFARIRRHAYGWPHPLGLTRDGHTLPASPLGKARTPAKPTIGEFPAWHGLHRSEADRALPAPRLPGRPPLHCASWPGSIKDRRSRQRPVRNKGAALAGRLSGSRLEGAEANNNNENHNEVPEEN